MSYPQPDADKYATGGYQFFRLNTLLSSPGDIYESSQSGLGFAVGPDSDIANVNVAYFDDQVDTFMQFAVISPNRALVGRLDARNEASYAPAGRPGKILFWSDDIYDPNFRPRAFVSGDKIEFVAPRLDVLEYFISPPSLGPARQDKSFVFQDYSVITGTLYIVVPYYGRKYCFTQFTNRNATDPTTYGISAVNYAITQDGSPNPYHQETVIHAAATVTSGNSVTQIITAKNQGTFDALIFSVTNAGPAPLRIVMSDQDQG